MKVDVVELVITEGPEVVGLVVQAEKSFSPKPTTAVGWLTAFGFLPTSIMMGAATVFDTIRAQQGSGQAVTRDEVMTLLGVDPNGVLGHLEHVVSAVITAVQAGQAPSTTPPAPAAPPSTVTTAPAVSAAHPDMATPPAAPKPVPPTPVTDPNAVKADDPNLLGGVKK